MTPPNLLNAFLHEADDLLSQIEELAVDLNGKTPDSEAINQLFRAFHTIKGSGAMFGFDAVVGFTHHVETTLDQVREGSLAFSPELLSLVLAAKDEIKSLLDAVADGGTASSESSDRIVRALNLLAANPPSGTSALMEPGEAFETPAADLTGNRKIWNIRFRPSPSMIACGTNPVALLNELRGLGDCSIEAHVDSIPTIDQIQPDQCYFHWSIKLHSQASLNCIRDVFIFVEDVSDLAIEEAQDSFVRSFELPIAAPACEARPVAPKAQENRSNAAAKSSKDSTVRVPSAKLDRLVSLVGELVMNQSRLTQAASRMDASPISAPVEEIERLVAELRDNVLGIRMMPIGATFSRFKRLVHDLAAELGKEIDLVTEGAETELDKTVLDQLGEPLVHLIRNSVDHGIEAGEKREQSGKGRRGTLRLTAVHTGSNVVVTIEDDGRGLDPAAIRAKAIEKQLISGDANLSEKEIFNLIFLPGFSTAKQITNVSGRGFGMDVVKRQIEALRGSVGISSVLGKGTTISLTLPLTLVIIDGLLVGIGGDQFIIPMSVVTENVEIHRAERYRNNGRSVVAVRGDLIPYIRLRDAFDMEGPEPDIEKIVIAQFEDQRVGLVVDRVLGSHQTVIQSLGRFYRNIDLVSGATIMGDGRVALILDLAGLVKFADQAGKPLTESSHSPSLGKICA